MPSWAPSRGRSCRQSLADLNRWSQVFQGLTMGNQGVGCIARSKRSAFDISYAGYSTNYIGCHSLLKPVMKEAALCRWEALRICGAHRDQCCVTAQPGLGAGAPGHV